MSRGCLPYSWRWPEPSSTSLPPPTRSDWGWSPQRWSLPHMEKWQKLFLCWALPYTSLLCRLMLLLGVELLATTFAGKHMVTVMPNFVLARHLQRLESFVTYITGVNPLSLSLLCLVPLHWSHPARTWFPSQTCPGARIWAPLFMCSLKLILVLKVM